MLLWENLDEGRHLAAHPERLSKNPFMERFAALIAEGEKCGLFRRPRDRKHLLINLIGICFIYYSNRYSLAASIGLSTSPADRSARVEQAVDLILNGMMRSSRQAAVPLATSA
jgi:hypothetical protein